MEFNVLFNPVELTMLDIPSSLMEQEKQLLVNKVTFFSGEQDFDLSRTKIAIIGISESRNSYENTSCSLAPEEIRRQFYRLYAWEKNIEIVDFGNLLLGETVEDTYAVLSDIVAYLIDMGIIPIILGGSNDLAYACYRGYEKLEKIVNIVSVDALFDLGNENSPIRSHAYLNKIILRQPNYLLNYANIGYQTYMNSQESLELMEKLYFETYRVGLIRKDMEEVEPIVRDAGMLSLDVSAIRRPDAPGNPHGSSNGFYGEEICRITRFAGCSDNLSLFGVYEYDPTLDYNNQTSQLLSQAIWYFIEGILHRFHDTSFKDKNNYLKYTVTVSCHTSELVFYKSKKSGRWWVVVPVLSKKKNMDRKYFLPCSQSDFDKASNDIIPERWWRAFQKMNR